MNKKTFKYISRSLILIAAGSVLTSCSGNEGSFPQIANPPPFDYVDGEELRSGMHQLAFALQRLDLVLANEDGYEPSPGLQRSVLETLGDIKREGDNLQSSDLKNNHPFLADGMGRFLSDVERAQFDAKRERYYMAGKISGSCMSCHRANY